jgi:hypothetical protein
MGLGAEGVDHSAAGLRGASAALATSCHVDGLPVGTNRFICRHGFVCLQRNKISRSAAEVDEGLKEAGFDEVSSLSMAGVPLNPPGKRTQRTTVRLDYEGLLRYGVVRGAERYGVPGLPFAN